MRKPIKIDLTQINIDQAWEWFSNESKIAAVTLDFRFVEHLSAPGVQGTAVNFLIWNSNFEFK